MLRFTHNDTTFGVGDKVTISQRIQEGERSRTSSFEGIVIALKGREVNKMFTVRKIGVGGVGIERIFPLYSPTIEKIEVVKKGGEGIKRSKLYYIRGKSVKEIDEIYSRVAKKAKNAQKPSKKSAKKRKKH